jgi:hypothetical protein
MAEPRIVVENRKELTYLLCQAAELEHGLMCEYLYGAFSLKREPDESLDGSLMETVERWRSTILRVAAEEMLHWALVNNLLTAVGSAPYVSRPHFPHQARGYPAGVQLALVGFGERALRHFLYLERPEGMEGEDADGFEATGPALPIMSETDILPWGQEFSTVSHLYRSIEAGLENLATRMGEDMLFIGPQRAQATPASFGWPDLVPIVDLPTALGAIDRIVEQGEGARGDWSEAHYGRFLSMLDEYLALKKEDPSFEPAHAVHPAHVRPVDEMMPETWITDPVTAAVTDLFNAVYDLILQMIVRFFAFGEETDEQLRALAHGAVGLMFAAIKPLGLLLATLPIGPEHPGINAGANFQLSYRSSFLLPHRRAAWIRFGERLDEIASFAERTSGPPAVRATLDGVTEQVRKMVSRMGPYLEG